MKHISKSAILLAAFVIAMAAGWQGSVYQTTNADWNSEQEYPLGSITVCKIIANENGIITNGAAMASTTFSIAGIDFAGNETVPPATNVLPTSVFATPLSLNTNLIGNDHENDTACVTYNDLALGSYYYNEEDISKNGWNAPRYNDQYTTNVSTLDDFFSYSGELFTESRDDDSLRNTNADGHIILGAGRTERTLVILNRVAQTEDTKECSDNLDNDEDEDIDENDAGCHTDGNPDNPGTYDPTDDDENAKPIITLLGNATMAITEDGGYTDAGASAEDEEDGTITDDIVTVNNVDHTTPGTYSVTYNVTDSDGSAADQVTRTIIINARETGCTSNCGGGGGNGGGSGSSGGGSKINLEITHEAITLNDTGMAVVTWNTNLQSTSQVLYDVTSRGSTTTPPAGGSYLFRTATSTTFVTSHSMTITGLAANITYYFRPVSARADEDAIGKELKIMLATSTATTTIPTPTTSTVITRQPCQEYLLNYIKISEQNDAFEVRKLETFLNVFEGFSLPVDGIYDQRDFDAVVAFQERYFDDILKPWGHTAGTGYVYYTTRKKINEIFCQRVFPLSDAQAAEIAEFKTFLESLRQTGGSLDDIDVGSTVGVGTETPASEDDETILGGFDATGDAKNLVARLYDSLKDRMRTVGVILILLAILLAGIALFRSHRQKYHNNDFPPLV